MTRAPAAVLLACFAGLTGCPEGGPPPPAATTTTVAPASPVTTTVPTSTTTTAPPPSTTLPPGGTPAASGSVFEGDPIDPASGRPYEIVPGQPLVKPGPDGRWGTADDIVDRAVTGDIDLVARLGEFAETGEIPPPSPFRGSMPTGISGIRGLGEPIPFTVFVSDGIVAPDRPYGRLLADEALNGLPVVVLVFADLDGDGVVGPVVGDAGAAVRALAELEPVGEAVAFFEDGVARGRVAVTAGGPADEGGLMVVATAVALTGVADPAFLEGFVPAGPALMTALPFLPERDPARLFTSDLGPLAGTESTLNPRLRAAALPDPGGALALALAADGSSPTVDTARVVAGPAVCARLFEPAAHLGAAGLALTSDGEGSRAVLRVAAADLLGNPTGPVAPTEAQLYAIGPFAVSPASVSITTSGGAAVTVTALAAGRGSLRVAVNGAVCQTVAVESRPSADAVVGGPAADFPTIAAAIATAGDLNGDGQVTIEVGEGVFRETLRVERPLELRGLGAGRTVIDAQGRGPALVLRAAGARATALTTTGGTAGVIAAAPARLEDIEAWRNLGPGFFFDAPGAAALGGIAHDNGTDGFVVDESAEVRDVRSVGNAVHGIAVSSATGTVLAGNVVTANGDDGIVVGRTVGAEVTDNVAVGNLASGIVVRDSSGGRLIGNRGAGNGEDGLRLRDVLAGLVARNDFTANGGFGVRLEQAEADFDEQPGVQGPPGSNDLSGNGKGPLRIDD